MIGEQPTSGDIDAYATSHNLLHQLQQRLGRFQLDVSPKATGFKGLQWLKHGHRMRKLWEGKRVLVDCTRGERFPGHIRNLLETFLAAKQENGRTSALFVLPY